MLKIKSPAKSPALQGPSSRNRPALYIDKFHRDIIALSQHCVTGLQIYGGPGSLSHDFKIWPITFQGSGPSGPILFGCENISL